MKRKTSPAVRDALLARCILERAKDKDDYSKICEEAEWLFDSLFSKLTPAQKDEYEKFIERARTEELKWLLAECSSAHGPS